MLAEIEDRLTASAPSLKFVQGAAEFAAIKANPPKNRQPGADVLPLRERAGANLVAVNATRQRNTVDFAVVLALGNFADRRGGTASKAMGAVRDEVKAALIGWQPTADMEQIEYSGGAIVDFRDGVVWWQDDFTTSEQISG